MDNRFLDLNTQQQQQPSGHGGSSSTSGQSSTTTAAAASPSVRSNASPAHTQPTPPTSSSGSITSGTAPVPHAPTAAVPSPYLRQELHHHQHQHTHLHQHQQLLPTALAAAPPPAPAPLFPPPLFKDIPKIAAVDSPFYRTGLGLPGYAGYSPAGLMHPGLGGATPFMPPSHLTSFAPKVGLTIRFLCINVPIMSFPKRKKLNHSLFHNFISWSHHITYLY